MIQLPIPKERNLFLADQVDQQSINSLSKSILEINESDQNLIRLSEVCKLKYTPEPIKLYIDSYGGAIYQCFGLLGIMEKSNIPIHTIVTGCAMSAGFLIAITGHQRFAYSKATFMYHQISTGFFGTSKDLEETYIEVKRIQQMLEDHVLEKTTLSKKQLEENYGAKKDWYISSKEAIKYNIIDTII